MIRLPIEKNDSFGSHQEEDTIRTSMGDGSDLLVASAINLTASIAPHRIAYAAR